jgi:predicted outer membrane protein
MGVTKELSLRWEETRNYWRDAKSQEFDKKYMEELLARVDKAVTIIEKLDEVLKKVQSDCE